MSEIFQQIVTYSSTLLRVKAILTPKLCRDHDFHKQELIERAQKKFSAIAGQSQLAGYVIYEESFLETWTALRNQNFLPDDYEVHVTLGQGYPNLEGLEITVDPDGSRLGFLSYSSQNAQNWQFEWLKAYVDEYFVKSGIKTKPSPAHIFSFLKRIGNGRSISRFPLHAKAENPEGRNFRFITDKSRGEVTIAIYDLKPIMGESRTKSFINAVIKQLIVQSKQHGVNYRFLEKYFIQHLNNAMNSPKILGFSLPLTILSGVRTEEKLVQNPVIKVENTEVKPKAIPSPAKPKPAMSPSTPASPSATSSESEIIALLVRHIKIEIIDDDLTAKICEFNPDLYKSMDAAPSAEILTKFFSTKGIKYGCSSHYISDISKAITNQKNLMDMTVAVGKPPRQAKQPFLFPVFEYALKNKKSSEDKIDIRESQKQKVVGKDELIAQIQYKEPPQEGINVKGEEIPPPPGEPFSVNKGENVVEKEAGKFYAQADGMPVVKHNYVMLRVALVHEGDVNLVTGNIHFKGDVEIKGNIEAGSLVETTGNLTVSGRVHSGFIRVGGNLDVKEGIITGTLGTITVKGNVKADFIENSRLSLQGNLKVKRTILNSTIISSGTIELENSDNVIAGGAIFSWGNISCANLGLKRGSPSMISLGINPKIEERILRFEKRSEKLEIISEESRKSLRELMSRKGLANHVMEEKKEEMRVKLVKCRELADKISTRLTTLKIERSYNLDAQLLVSNQLMSHTKIELCGKIVPLNQDYAGVAIVTGGGKGSRASKIVPIEEILKNEDSKDGKKAS